MRFSIPIFVLVVLLFASPTLAQFADPGPVLAPVQDVIEGADVITPLMPEPAMGIVTTDVGGGGLMVTTPVGTPPDPNVTPGQLVAQGKEMVTAFKDGKVLVGIGILLSLLMTLLLKLIAYAAKNPAFMAAKWFRNAVPVATFALSTILVVFLAVAGKLPFDEMATAILGVATGAIAWWETVGQHIFKKPSELGATPPAKGE